MNSQRLALAKQMRTRSVTAAQARSYLSKAEEYLATSENEFEAERRTPRRAWQFTPRSTPRMLSVVLVSVDGQLVQTTTRS